MVEKNEQVVQKLTRTELWRIDPLTQTKMDDVLEAN